MSELTNWLREEAAIDDSADCPIAASNLRQAADELDRLTEYREHHEFAVSQIGEAISKEVKTAGDVLNEINRLHALLSNWQATGDAIMVAVRGTPGPLSDSDVIGELERLRAYIATDARCPCCEETETCLDGCTYEQDVGTYSDDYQRMIGAREVLKARTV